MAETYQIQIVSMETLLQTADIVTLHIPGNKDKTAIISTNELSLMKNGAFLVNYLGVK